MAFSLWLPATVGARLWRRLRRRPFGSMPRSAPPKRHQPGLWTTISLACAGLWLRKLRATGQRRIGHKQVMNSISCTYCGKPKPETTNHIPPACLFPSPRPSDLITVPCCLDCNGGASKDDEYFRMMMVMRRDATHPAVPSSCLRSSEALANLARKACCMDYFEACGPCR